MLTARQKHCLQGIGITHWQTRSAGETDPAEPVTDAPSVTDIQDQSVQPPPQNTTPPQPIDLTDWPQTLDAIENCTRCELAKSCTRKVPGKGSQQADLMIIGEAPGHDEDLQGQPFVGRAGRLLDRMLKAIDIQPEQVYITNILKCRPPQNRDPRIDEIKACSLILQAQIKLIQPEVIFSIGRISAQNLLQDHRPLGKLRGSQYTLPDSEIPIWVTYHPAYLLRNPVEKAKVWHDLKLLKKILDNATN